MQSSFKARFWGVRGSIPSPGVSTIRYGGNTSCVSVHLPARQVLIFDAGTGIRELGKYLAAGSEEIFVLLSHSHWDHIQGYPYFAPIYQPDRRIFLLPTLFGGTTLCGMCQKIKAAGEKNLRCPLLDQMDGAHFPVKSEQVPSKAECITMEEMNFLQGWGFNIRRIATNHPGGGFGYRVENDGKSIVYLTDNELEPPNEKATNFEDFVRFCWKADVLIHDAMYVEPDMPWKHGWGHSLVRQVCDLASKAEVKQLILYHHDPDRSDQESAGIELDARRQLVEKHPQVSCTVAFEGLSLAM